MKTLKDGAALLILLTFLVSVRITPVEEPQGGIFPETRAATEQSVQVPTEPEAVVAEPARLLEPVDAADCPLRLKALRTGKNGSPVFVIEIDEVEQAAPAKPARAPVEVARTTC